MIKKDAYIDNTVDISLIDIKNMRFELSFNLDEKIQDLFSLYMYYRVVQSNERVNRSKLGEDYTKFRKMLSATLLKELLDALENDKEYKKHILDNINQVIANIAEKPAKDFKVVEVQADANGVKVYIEPIFK